AFPLQSLSSGTHRITVTAFTDTGATSNPVIFDIRIPPPQLPVISITSPHADATFIVGATVTVEAIATDSDGSIKQIEFLVDNEVVCTVTAAPYRCDVTPGEGSHILTARATDSQGLSTISTPVTITIAPPSQVTIHISQPSDNSELAVNENTTIVANVDGDGVQQVEFLINEVMLCSLERSPYTCMWQPETAGSYTLLARAHITNGAVDSATIIVSVGDPDPLHNTIYLPLLMR
ncbi:MAG: hypothetical protein KDE53_25330, partial [Caldilineaceae bacterium]|nr:hypothetical protein [Caldilineaceae bacterium]